MGQRWDKNGTTIEPNPLLHRCNSLATSCHLWCKVTKKACKSEAILED